MLLLCPGWTDATRRCIEHASEFRSSWRVVRENRKRRSVTSEALRRTGCFRDAIWMLEDHKSAQAEHCEPRRVDTKTADG